MTVRIGTSRRPNEGFGIGCLLLFLAWNAVGAAAVFDYGREWWTTAVLILLVLHGAYWIAAKVSRKPHAPAEESANQTPPDDTQ